MKKAFQNSISSSGKRPITDFSLDQSPRWKFTALIDSGSSRSWIDSRIAEALEIDLGDQAQSTIGLGGGKHTYRLARVGLRIERYRWVSEVGFIDNWNYDHQILGLQGIFDFFDVRIDPNEEFTDLRSRGYPRVETLRSRTAAV